MKWVFLAFLAAFTPLLAVQLRNRPNYLPAVAFCLGLLPFVQNRLHLSVDPISWPAWQGISKGTEVSIMDAIAVAIIFATRTVKAPWRLKVALGILVLGFAVSTALAPIKMPSLFYGWTILRTVVAFYAMARACQTHPRVAEAFLTGLILGIASQAVVTSIEFAGGSRQAGGWFGHQNLLGMVTHFTVYPAFALFLAGRDSKRTGLAVVACLIVAFTGGSRATIGLMGIGHIATLLLSCSQGMTSRKGAVMAVTLLASLIIAPVMYSAIARRSAADRQASTDERGKMMLDASLIVADYPFGVGANRFVPVSNVGGYRDRAGVNWVNGMAPVHNSYYLVAAEMGWIGLFGLLSVFAAALSVGFTAMRRARGTTIGDYSTGLIATFAVVAFHSYQEWVTMLAMIHLLLGHSLGIVGSAASASVRRQVANGRRLLSTDSRLRTAKLQQG